MTKKIKKQYISKFYGIPVRSEIIKEFTRPDGKVDDFMTGLHEVRVKMSEKLFKAHFS